MSQPNPSQYHSCFDDFNLPYSLSYNYGAWTFQKIYNTNLLACLPSDSWSALAEDWQKQPLTILHLPANNDELAKMEIHETQDPYLLLYFNSQGKTEEDSVQQWLIDNVGGKFNNSDFCLTNKENGSLGTTADYPSPDNIIYQTSVIKLQNTKGESVRFESCKTRGIQYALLIDNSVYIIGYEHGLDQKNVHGEELLQAILRTMKVSS